MKPRFALVAGSAIAALTLLGCSASTASDPEAQTPNSPHEPVKIGEFPPLPEQPLPDAVVVRLQAALDQAVDDGTVREVTAAVIATDAGSWAGAATSYDVQAEPLTAETSQLTASVGKTFIAAQVLRLAEEGHLELDDRAQEHLPPKFAAFDLNGATVRDFLGMRSGFDDPDLYGTFDATGDMEGAFAALKPMMQPGVESNYANINYDVLAVIVEHVTGQRLAEALGSGVVNDAGLAGFSVRVDPGRYANDGHMWTDAGTLARWGYQLYGGFVLSADSLAQMTDFKDDNYALGVIDFHHPATIAGFDVPAIGHGGDGPSTLTRLVAFPDSGVVVAVQADADHFEQLQGLIEDLRDEARR